MKKSIKLIFSMLILGAFQTALADKIEVVDNKDGTTTINHGKDVSETYADRDTAHSVAKDYENKGHTITKGTEK